ETLCNVPAIIENGAEWFKQVGTEKSTGSKVVSVSGNVRRPGNYEIELGIPTRDIVYGLAGGPPEGHRVKCWFPGGSSAPVLKEEDLDLAYDFETMADAGSMLGSGSIIVVDDSVSIVSLALRLAEFYRHESCGKCTPCREGTNWTVKMLERIDHGEATPADLDVMADVQTNIIGNCLCVLGDSMAMPVGSMIEKFRDEFEAHIEEARRRNGGLPLAAHGGRSDQVKAAQNAVVEFLLINHPLDCPVCDKGGECPLQDISFGWGAGRSRYIEPKRHFKKPIELSPLVAIDRERCILCYRCVRF